jgi:hypothetical protein
VPCGGYIYKDHVAPTRHGNMCGRVYLYVFEKNGRSRELKAVCLVCC